MITLNSHVLSNNKKISQKIKRLKLLKSKAQIVVQNLQILREVYLKFHKLDRLLTD